MEMGGGMGPWQSSWLTNVAKILSRTAKPAPALCSRPWVAPLLPPVTAQPLVKPTRTHPHAHPHPHPHHPANNDSLGPHTLRHAKKTAMKAMLM